MRRSRTDSASVTASLNSLAVLVTNSLVTLAFSPFQVALSDLVFMALASVWSCFSLVIISVHSVTAVSSGPSLALRSCSKVGMAAAAPQRKYLSICEAVTAPSCPGATGPMMRS